MFAALQLGKLVSRGRLNAVAPGPLVHIENQLSKRRFLVDTGASFSIKLQRFLNLRYCSMGGET